LLSPNRTISASEKQRNNQIFDGSRFDSLINKQDLSEKESSEISNYLN
jgi:hypothetical protein